MVLRPRWVRDILAPLLASRRFYQEAMPELYALNCFHCQCVERLYHVVDLLSPARRQHLTYISVYYRSYHSGEEYLPSWKRMFEILSSIKSLRIFELTYPEVGFQRDEDPSVLETPGIEFLGLLRGLEEVKFHECPSIERKYKELMLSPRLVEVAEPDESTTKALFNDRAEDRNRTWEVRLSLCTSAAALSLLT